VPGSPVALMPDAVLHPPAPGTEPLASPPPASTVDAGTTKLQIVVLNALAKAVTNNYVDPKFNGRDWPAIVARYRKLVEGGLSQDDFYLAMQLLVAELGDDHSQFESPADRQAFEQELAGHNEYAGIGVSVDPIPEAGRAAVILTFPGSPAERAGLQPHDLLLAIDGSPIFDSGGNSMLSRVRGPAGTQVTLTLQRPGEAVHDVTITRAHVNSGYPVESCVIAGTGVGYIFVPTLLDQTVPGQVRSALKAMTATGPLAGLLIDNRLDAGGASSVLQPLLGFFLKGDVGAFQSRTATRRLVIKGEDIGGSQKVPLVVLVGRGTVSFGEVMSGVLQASGRAVVVGETSFGNVETLSSFDFVDGSRAWIAKETFNPDDARYGPWEDTGIEPDVTAPTRWDLFTESNDPALAASLQALGVH
jgi:carboxyl-terminal processing protease